MHAEFLTIAGLRIRFKGDADLVPMARLHLASWKAAYRGFIADDYLDALTNEAWEERWRQKFAKAPAGRIDLVCEDDACALLGFVSAGPNRWPLDGFSGEIWSLHAHPERRREGIGRALIGAAASLLAGAGHKTVMLWTLEENRAARAFYESLGGEVFGQQLVELGSVNYPEVAYGWRDIQSLIAAARAKDSA